jgi:polyhydroxyalkanoate synthesis regulator phasin
MVRDALSNYLTMASGLTEVTRQRARAAAKALVAQGGATVEQVGSLAEEVLQTSRANRAALLNLVRYEIENTFGRLGLASAEEVASLRQRITELERAAARDRADAVDAAAAAPAPPRAAPAKKATRKAAKSGAAKTSPAKSAKAGTAKKAAKKTGAPAKKAAGPAPGAGTEG